jgi:hypothetical protein
MKTRRRDMLLGATAAVAAAGSLAAPAIAQGVRELKLVTDWPKNLAGIGTSVERLARSITALSDGRLKVTVYPANSLVRAQTFDGVGGRGRHVSFRRLLLAKSPALNFFARRRTASPPNSVRGSIRRRAGFVDRSAHSST